jgi:Ca-activated chloride channel family protein
LNIAFNPTLVKDYRLIGFDNKIKVLSDSLNEVQGGEVGSGHSLLALFEISPTDPDSVELTDKDELAKLVINYKLPHDSLVRTTAYTCSSEVTPFNELQPCYRFASSIALFGGLLKHSKFMPQSGWKSVIGLAEKSSDPQDGMQQEFIGLIEKARKIYAHQKKRKVDD